MNGERVTGPISLEATLRTNPPKREVFSVKVKGVEYEIGSMVARLKGAIVYVVPGSTEYIGDTPPKPKSEAV